MGNLAETPLATLLLGLARDQFEGWLTLERPGLSRRFRWRKGAPIQLVSTRPADSLTALLAARGQLTPSQASAAAKKLELKPGNELAALAAAGVAPKDLLLGIASALELALADCLGWPNGSFDLAFEPAPGDAPALPLSLHTIVFESVAANWRADQSLSALGERATRFPSLARGAEAKLGAKLAKSPAMQAITAQLGGASSAFEALREARHPHAHAALWLLDACGLLVYQDARAESAEAKRAGGPEFEIVVATRAVSVDAAAAGAAQTAQTAQRDLAREAAAAALRKEVVALHERLAGLDLWQILGVERGAPPSEVKRAYLQAAKRLHPDHLMRLGLDDLKETANSVFTQIARAHEVLTDADERARYTEETAGISETQALLAAQAEQYFQRGEMLMRAGNFRGASEFLERAVQTYAAEPEYHAAYAWALHRKQPPENERALQHFERALEGGEQPRLLLRMSLLLRELRQDARAAQFAARAKALDPNVRA